MEDFQHDITECLRVLKEGGTILYPTDTIWGIGCDATNPAAVRKVYELKNRSDEKSLIILLASEKDVLRYVAQPDLQVFDYLKSAFKPTTVIYDGAIGLAENLVGKDGTVAIRIVRDQFCKDLVNRLKKPLVSTSANISGEPFPKNFDEIPRLLKENVDYVVSYRQKDPVAGQPSALVRWSKGQPVLLR